MCFPVFVLNAFTDLTLRDSFFLILQRSVDGVFANTASLHLLSLLYQIYLCLFLLFLNSII